MYNVNDPDIIEKLTALTGNKEIAVRIYEDAVYIYDTLKIAVFVVRKDIKTGIWMLIIDNLSESIQKALSYDKEHS